MSGAGKTQVPAPASRPDPSPDQAWKALSLVNDWIRHAETKTAASLAATGVASGLLYTLVKGWQRPDVWGVSAAIVCAIALAGSAVLCALALAPRLQIKGQDRDLDDDVSNRLYFNHIAKSFKGNAPSYAQVLATLTSDPHELTRQIAHQVHANSDVASRKFRWVDLAICCLFLAYPCLALAAFIRALSG